MRPVTRSELPIGAVLSDKYRITREIGRGGMAAVYEAEHVGIGKRVAVKVLDPALASSATIVERFHREARAAAAVDSPYICGVHDASRLPDGRPYLVLELLEGESLYDRMCRLERLSPIDVVRILGQVARGLQKAHAAGIIHRDLKPENIFLSYDGDGQEVAKIVDFGLARFFGPTSTDSSPRLTREGAIFGTPMYMSPEQIGGQGGADHRSDLWAMGCIAFECLTGRPVWKVDQGVALIFAQIAAAPVPQPSRINPSLPHGFDAWVVRALARAPDERFQTAMELAEALAMSLGQDAAMTASVPIIITAGHASMPSRSALTQPESPENVEPFAPTEPPPAHETGSMAGADRTGGGLRSPTAPPVEPAQRQPRSRRWPLVALAGLAVVAAGATGFFVMRQASRGAPPVASSVALASSNALSRTVASASATASALPAPAMSSASPVPVPAFAAPIVKAQRLIAEGKREDAVRVLEQATAGSDSGAVLTMLDHARFAAAGDGPCRVTGLGRPRPFEWTSSIRSLSAAVNSSAIVVAWIDNQDDRQKWDLRVVRLNDDLLALDSPIEVVPSAGNTDNATVTATDARFLVAFGDDTIGTRGAFLRKLDTTGHPTGPLQRLSSNRASVTRPSAVMLSDGSIAAAFPDAATEGPADIMVQRFHADLTAIGPAMAIAHYAIPSSRQSGSSPALSAAGDSLVVAWRRETIREHAIVVRAVRAQDATSLWPQEDDGVVISEPRSKVRPPEISCWKESCIVVWRSEPSGSHMASIDAATGAVRWKKAFSSQGTQTGIALNDDGTGLVAWYDGGRVRVAPVTKEGAGESGVIGRAHGEQVTPSVSTTGRVGEWIVSWTCFEAGHPEAFVARVVCGS